MNNTLRKIAEPVWAHEGSDDEGKTWPHYFPAGVEPEFVDGRLYRSVIPREFIRAQIKSLQRDLDFMEGRLPKPVKERKKRIYPPNP